MNAQIFQFLDWSAALVVEDALRATLIVTLIAGASLLMRRAGASAKNLVWRSAIAAFLLVPVGTLLLPRWSVPIPTVVGTIAPAQVEPPPFLPSAPPPFEASNIEQIDASPTASAPLHNQKAESPISHTPLGLEPPTPVASSRLLGAIWLIGMAALLARLGAALLRLRALRRSGVRWDSMCSSDLPKEIFLHEKISAPMTWGLTSPIILFPKGAVDWPHARVRFALLHELGHIARKDFVWNLLGQLACAVFWFHPLAWLANSRMRVEAEHACDDLVLNGSNQPASTYAAELLAIAAGKRACTGLVAVEMAWNLEPRVRAILEPSSPRRAVTWREKLLTSTVIVIGSLAVACASPQAAIDSKRLRDAPPAIMRVSDNSAPELMIVALYNPFKIPQPLTAWSPSYDERRGVRTIQSTIDGIPGNSVLAAPSLWLRFRSRETDSNSFEHVIMKDGQGRHLLDSKAYKASYRYVQGAHTEQHPMAWTPSDDGVFLYGQTLATNVPVPAKAHVTLHYALGPWQRSAWFDPKTFPAPNLWGSVDELKEIRNEEGRSSVLELKLPPDRANNLQYDARVKLRSGATLNAYARYGNENNRWFYFRTAETNISSIQLAQRPLLEATYDVPLPQFDTLPSELFTNNATFKSLVGEWLAANWSEGRYSLRPDRTYTAEFGREGTREAGTWHVERNKVKFDAGTNMYDRPLVAVHPASMRWKDSFEGKERTISFRKIITPPPRTLTEKEKVFVATWVSRRGFVPGKIELRDDGTWEAGVVLDWPPDNSGTWELAKGKLHLKTLSAHDETFVGQIAKYVREETDAGHELIRRDEGFGGIGYYRQKSAPQ